MSSPDAAWVTVAAPRRRKAHHVGAPAPPQATPTQRTLAAAGSAAATATTNPAAALRATTAAAPASSGDDDSDDVADEADGEFDDAGDFTLGPGGGVFLRAVSPPLDVDAVDDDEEMQLEGDAAAGAEEPARAVGNERGAGWGRVPNLWWRAPRGSALRRHARFTALPPVAAVALSGDASLAFVRQDSALWAAAHAGRLTGGALLGALGCREPAHARRLGLPRAAASRAHAAAAAARLREAPFQPPPAHAAADAADAADADAESVASADAAAAAYNAAAVAAYNAALAAGGASDEEADDEAEAQEASEGAPASESLPPPAAAASSAPPQRAASSSARRKSGGGKKSGRGSRRASGASSGSGASGGASVGGGATSLSLLHTVSSIDAHAASAAAAAGGAAVRCAWGVAQEGGTLYALLAAFPEAMLAEVGLCALSPGAAAGAAAAAELPPGALNDLPALGASPDALIAWPPGSRWAPPANALGEETAAATILEVVEVKNVCPFREAPPAGSKRRGAAPARAYTLSDAGPHSAPPAAHMPQLQLEMAAAGTRSGLLVVESATRGMAVWRLRRDDAYVGAMLALLATFNGLYGPAGGALPSGAHVDIFPPSAAAAHAAFLRRTAALAAEAQMLDFIAAPRRPPDADARPFLD
jgi:uncharacterized membrane protein YgcG